MSGRTAQPESPMPKAEVGPPADKLVVQELPGGLKTKECGKACEDRPVMRRSELACPAGGQDPEHVLRSRHGTIQQQQPRNLKVGDIREPRKQAAVLCGQGVKLRSGVPSGVPSTRRPRSDAGRRASPTQICAPSGARRPRPRSKHEFWTG